MFGGTFVMGMLLKPSSNQACVAILTRVVSGSYHGIFLAVQGTCPRNIPFLEFGFNFAGFFPGGRTHTRHPNVRELLKLSLFPVAMVIGEIEFKFRVGIAFLARNE